MQQQSGYLILMYWWERLLWLNSSNINKNKQTAPPTLFLTNKQIYSHLQKKKMNWDTQQVSLK